MKFLHIFALLFVGVCITVLGDVFLKKSNGAQNLMPLLMGAVFYAVVAVPVAFAFKNSEFGIIFFLWEAMIIMVATMVSYFYFHESFTIFKTLALFSALVTIVLSYFAGRS